MQEKGHHWIPMLNLSTLLSMNKHSGDRIYPWRWKGGLLPAQQHHLLVGGKELRCKATLRVKHFNFCTAEGWQTSKFNFCKVQIVSDQSQTRKMWTVGHSWLPFHFWKHCRLSRGSAHPHFLVEEVLYHTASQTHSPGYTKRFSAGHIKEQWRNQNLPFQCCLTGTH